MNPSELSDSFIDYIKDQPILHPCFRLEDVKQALAHMAENLGLTPKYYRDIKSTFFYMLKDMPLAIMVTPVQYSDDRMCYAFRAFFPDKFPPPLDLSKLQESSKMTAWFTTPSHLYVKLLEKVQYNDVKYFSELFETKGLLPEQNIQFASAEPDPDVETILKRDYSWKDVEVLLALESCGYKSPSFYEFNLFIRKGIKPYFLKKLAAIGYVHFTLADIEVIWNHKIPLQYLEQLALAGYGRFKAVEYHTLFHAKVSPSAVLSLYNQGFTSLSSSELIQLANSKFSRLLPMNTGSKAKKLKKIFTPLKLIKLPQTAVSGNAG